jgi:hypothetical protein
MEGARYMTRSKFRKLVLPLAGLAVMAGCAKDDDTTLPQPGPQYATGLFARYVSLGNSITAGYQSGGINSTSQAQAYPVLIAKAANAVFGYPVLNGRGCTPPYRGPFLVDTGRAGTGATSATCDLRLTPVPALVQNLAVPGAKVGDALDNSRSGTAANTLTTLFLGGRTQAQAMIAAQPTLVSVFLGNNDALGAAVAGDTLALTSAAAFKARWDSLVVDIKQTPAGQGGADHDVVLIGIAPFPAILQPGGYFYFLQASDPTFTARTGKTVAPDCAPGTPGSANLVSLGIFGTAAPVISCADNAPAVLNQAEIAAFFGRIAAYNAIIKAEADANGWIYVDANEVLGGTGTTPFTLRGKLSPTQFRLCQGLATATLATFATQAATTCPAPTLGAGGAVPPYTPGSAAYANFFGSWMSFDAVHPTLPFHKALANAIINALNAKHGTVIPNIA